MKEYKSIKLNGYISPEKVDAFLNEYAKQGFELLKQTFKGEFLIMEKSTTTKEEILQSFKEDIEYMKLREESFKKDKI